MAGAGRHLRRTKSDMVAGKEAGLHVFMQAVSWVYGTTQQQSCGGWRLGSCCGSAFLVRVMMAAIPLNREASSSCSTSSPVASNAPTLAHSHPIRPPRRPFADQGGGAGGSGHLGPDCPPGCGRPAALRQLSQEQHVRGGGGSWVWSCCKSVPGSQLVAAGAGRADASFPAGKRDAGWHMPAPCRAHIPPARANHFTGATSSGTRLPPTRGIGT